MIEVAKVMDLVAKDPKVLFLKVIEMGLKIMK